MQRLSFRTLLIGLNAGLILLAVLSVFGTGTELMERLADEQALARVDLAGMSALEAVERSAGDVRTSARLLGERPTVGRLLRQRDAAGLTGFLDSFRRTSRLSACAILVGGQPVAAAGPDLSWVEVLRGGTSQTEAGGLVLGDSAPVVTFPGAVAVTALALDPPFIRGVASQVGLPVEILPAGEALARADDPRLDLRAEVLASGKPRSGRLQEAGLYLAVRPLPAVPGEVQVLVETSLPTAEVTSSLSRLQRRLLLLSLLVAALATLSGFLLSRSLARPVGALTEAAARIGHGDLATPMPRTAVAEIGVLAAAMEEMRRRLLRLTSELRRRQAEGEAILTGVVEGVYSVDRDRNIRYLNPQAAALLGLRPEEAIGRFCGDVLRPAGRDGVRPCEEHCPIVHARFRGGTSAVENLQLADGTRRTVVLTSAPPTEDRQVQLLRDETDVEAARRLRDTILANISHEFKTPLSAQLASIELLRERLSEKGDTDTGDHVLSLERGSLRLSQLIDNLLESVRIEAGQDSIRRRPVALDEVVEEAVELTAPLIAQRGQRIDLDLPYPLPGVRGDAPRLTQVFVNLLANANKFAPAGSALRVGGAVTAREVLLWVEDQGPGLPQDRPNQSARSVFGRFMRSSEDEEPEQSGMGLGLWIVQSIVERHGGAVEAVPGEDGIGTRMVVRLPREAAEREAMEKVEVA